MADSKKEAGAPEGATDHVTPPEVASSINLSGSEDKSAKVLEPKPELSIEFLGKLRSEGPWVLCAFGEDGSKDFKTFKPGQESELSKWIHQQNNDKLNCYWHVNSVPENIGRAKKSDVLRMQYFHVDCDPRKGDQYDIDEERARILADITKHEDLPKPTVVLFSGGGYQVFWSIIPSIEIGGDIAKAEDAERYNIQIAKLIGGDSCHNSDRIMRLPGTCNYPNAKKRANGQTPVMAVVVEELTDWDLAYDHTDLDLFIQAPPDVAAGSSSGGGRIPPLKLDWEVANRRLSASELEDALSEVESGARAVIVVGHDEDKHGPVDKSDMVWHAACAMTRGGVDASVQYSILRDPDLGINDHIIGQGNEKAQERATLRAIARGGATARADEAAEGGGLTAYEWGFRQSLGGVSLRYNEFTDRATIDGLPGFGPQLTDAAMMRLRMLLYENDTNDNKRLLSKELLGDLCANEAQHNKFHPVRDYLDGLVWDGVARVDSWMIDYLSAEESKYTRAVSRIFMIAGVRRIRQPGCKFDELPVLEGSQGGGKSTLLARLAVRAEWFSDDLPLNLDGKRIIEQTAGKWIIEFGEMQGMRKGQHQALKSMLSRGTDCGRMAYAKLSVDMPRQWLGLGTTNDSGYLSDPTGNRRFWPVNTGLVDLDGFTPAIVDQLWAEAAHLEAAGESIRLAPSLWSAAAEIQQARTTEDPFTEAIEAALVLLPEGYAAVFSEDLWAVAGYRDQCKRSQPLNALLGAAMKRAGFERKKVRRDGVSIWGYRRGVSTQVVPKFEAEFLGGNGAFSAWNTGEKEPF